MYCLKKIREFVCFNQKQLIQYEYLVSERHKELRKYLESNSNEDEISELLQNLIDIAYGNLLNILYENVENIYSMLKSIGLEIEPNITIKTLENGAVLDFFRSHASANLSTTKIESNTGFSEIMNDSKRMYFIRHDLETDFLNEDYDNPRLNANLREKFRRGEISWEECWTAVEGSEESFHYRSTLIIPMSIRVNENDDEVFIKKFSRNVSHSDKVRTVWGFLCFDSTEKNVFKDMEDELRDIGYIVADILSLYLMFFYNHISGSETFNEALKISEE
jgi:hypothetical protein